MKSSTIYYYFIKLFAVICMSMPIIFAWIVLTQDIRTDTGQPVEASQIALGFVGAAIFASLGVFAWLRLAILDCSETEVTIHRRGRKRVVPWSQVEKVIQIPFCTPPVYRMSFKTGEPPAYCLFFSFFVASIGVWSWDFRGFIQYARRRIERGHHTSTATIGYRPPPVSS